MIDDDKNDIDGLIRYFEMAYKVMGWTNPEENSYEYHAAKMLKQLRDKRDNLRWEVCELSSNGSIDGANREAESRGWNYLVDD